MDFKETPPGEPGWYWCMWRDYISGERCPHVVQVVPKDPWDDPPVVHPLEFFPPGMDYTSEVSQCNAWGDRIPVPEVG